MKQRKTLKLPIFCLIYFAVIVFCVVADQLTKLWVYDILLEGETGNSVPVIGKFLQFTSVLNRGAAFGMGESQASDIVFFVVTVIGVPVFVYLLLRSRTRSLLSQISFAMIIGGTIGNAIDRGFYATQGTFFSGGVRDFISFSIFPPVFNVADLFLTAGVFMAIAAIVWFDPDSLIKIMAEERAQKLSQQTSQTDTSTQTTDGTDSQPTDWLDGKGSFGVFATGEEAISAVLKAIAEEEADENDTTN